MRQIARLLFLFSAGFWLYAQTAPAEKIRLTKPATTSTAVAVTTANPNEKEGAKAETVNSADIEEKKSGFKIPKPFFFNMYFRMSAQDDFGYNSPTLGWGPFYGRLMNETPWLMADFGYHVVRPETPGGERATLFMRIEGGSFRGYNVGQGSLGNFNINHIWLETENVLLKTLVTQTGNLWYNMGYIGIFDNFTSQVFYDTIGFRAGQRTKWFEYFAGVGDSGWTTYRNRTYDGWDGHQYATIPTVGGLVKLNLYEFQALKGFSNRFMPKWQIGTTFQMMWERENETLRGAPYQTPNVQYADVMRGEAFKKFMLENPGNADFFPWAQPARGNYWRYTAWTGFGGPEIGPFKVYWNDLSVRFEKKAPQIAVKETYDGETKDIYISQFTDERYEFSLYDEIQLRLLPNHFDLNMGFGFGKSWDNDNRIRPDDYNMTRYAFVIRPMWYITEHLHYLLELVYAREKSTIGNRYREHFNSIKSNTQGAPDTEGLEWGDTDTKYTYQIKTGFTINPAGRGIYSRPVIRLLYGVQHSNVQAAFGNSFEESLNRRNQFNLNRDIHWHHMARVEVEHWFSVSGWEEGYTPPLAQQTERLSQVHKGVEVDPTKPKRYDIVTTIWGGWALQVGPLTTGLADRLVDDADGCLGLTSRQCVINYTSGGVTGGAQVGVRAGNLAWTGGLWYLPVYQYDVDRTTGSVNSYASFLAATAGVRYYAYQGLFVGAEVGYGIPLIQHLVRGAAKSVDLGTYAIGALSVGYQYRMGAFSIEAGARMVFMPTSPVAMAVMPNIGVSYHL